MQISAAAEHTCAVLSNGRVECWGWNGSGALGDGGTESSDSPVEVVGVDSATAVTVGSHASCALLASGHIDCWGSEKDGELGNGEAGSEISAPVEVDGIADAIGVSAASDHHVCATLSSGEVDCWGQNNYGQLGDGHVDSEEGGPVDIPQAVPGIATATAASAGKDATCAVLSSGHVLGWGENELGQLGIGVSGAPSPNPVEVHGLTGAVSVGAGEHACAIVSAGHVDCWGDNEYGQLGDATTTGPEECAGESCSTMPVEARGEVSGASQLSVGEADTCAVFPTGYADCWGDNEAGQLGIGIGSEDEDVPVPVHHLG